MRKVTMYLHTSIPVILKICYNLVYYFHLLIDNVPFSGFILTPDGDTTRGVFGLEATLSESFSFVFSFGSLYTQKTEWKRWI